MYSLLAKLSMPYKGKISWNDPFRKHSISFSAVSVPRMVCGFVSHITVQCFNSSKFSSLNHSINIINILGSREYFFLIDTGGSR